MMALVGPVGCGKTAILSNWLSTTFRRVLQKETLVLQHHVRATEDAALPITINRRLASLLASLPEAPLDSPRFAHMNPTADRQAADVPVDEVVFFRDLLISASKIYNNVVIVLAVRKYCFPKRQDQEKKPRKLTQTVLQPGICPSTSSCERSAAIPQGLKGLA